MNWVQPTDFCPWGSEELPNSSWLTGSGSRERKLGAIIEAAGTRLRPILMTTAATVVGHFPLVIATRPGAGARNSIGIMLVTGMIIGSAFTLFVAPSIYMLVARTRTGGPVPAETGSPEPTVRELAEATV